MSVRVGFIGTGGIANYHFRNLEQIPEAKIVAVCDVVQEKVAAAATRFGATAYTDFRKMLDQEQLQAVYVCLPPFAHGAPELAIAKKKLAMLVEKPIAKDAETLKKVAAAVKRSGIITAVGYQDRYQDTIDRLKQFLAGKEVGLMMGSWMGGMPGVEWWRQRGLSGGQHVEQTTHIFDMARYLFGEVKRVSAVGSSGLMKDVPKYDIEDASAVNLEFRSGMIGTIFSACYLKAGGGFTGIRIFGKEFFAEYVERQSVKIALKDRTEEYRVTNDIGLKENQVFIEAVRTGDPSQIRSSYEDAARSLQLSLAASESMATGQFIRLK